MNKFSLLIVSLFFLAKNANATTNNRFSPENKTEMNKYGANTISFIENGIAFYVFPNGQFDFDTPALQRVVYNNYGRRTGISVNLGINVDRDYYGRIIRIGNVPLDYDMNNRIRRIGSVWMNYNYYGLTNVGGLQIIYNNYNQIVQMVGSVNPQCVVNNYPVYGPNYGNNSNYYGSYHPDNNNHYYYDNYKYNGGHTENHTKYGNGNHLDSNEGNHGGYANAGGNRDGGGSENVPDNKNHGNYGNAQGARDSGSYSNTQGIGDQGASRENQGGRR